MNAVYLMCLLPMLLWHRSAPPGTKRKRKASLWGLEPKCQLIWEDVSYVHWQCFAGSGIWEKVRQVFWLGLSFRPQYSDDRIFSKTCFRKSTIILKRKIVMFYWLLITAVCIVLLGLYPFCRTPKFFFCLPTVLLKFGSATRKILLRWCFDILVYN